MEKSIQKSDFLPTFLSANNHSIEKEIDVDVGVSSKARWENADRWYEAEFICDLLGDLVFIRRWGGNHSRNVGMKQELVPNKEDGYCLIEKIHNLRIKRKPPYWRVY